MDVGVCLLHFYSPTLFFYFQTFFATKINPLVSDIGFFLLSLLFSFGSFSFVYKTQMEELKEPAYHRTDEERELITQARTGDARAFERLMHKYRRSVYYLIFRVVRNPEDAEDLTQETFIKAFGSIARFDPKFAFSTWLFKIATNNSIDFIRRKKMQTLSIDAPSAQEDSPASLLQIVDTALTPNEQMLKKERKEYLQAAIEQLPPRYRQLIELRYYKEYSYEEVTQAMGLPLGTVKAQLHRARELLTELLSMMGKNL